MGRGRGRPLPSPLRRLPLPHSRVPLSAPVVRPRGGPPAGGRSCSGRSHRAWFGPLVAHCGAFGPLARGPPAGPFRRRSRLCVRGCGVVRPPPSRFAPALPPPLARRSAPVSVARPAGGWSLRGRAVGVPRPAAAAGRGFSPRSLFVPPAPPPPLPFSVYRGAYFPSGRVVAFPLALVAFCALVAFLGLCGPSCAVGPRRDQWCSCPAASRALPAPLPVLFPLSDFPEVNSHSGPRHRLFAAVYSPEIVNRLPT